MRHSLLPVQRTTCARAFANAPASFAAARQVLCGLLVVSLGLLGGCSGDDARDDSAPGDGGGEPVGPARGELLQDPPRLVRIVRMADLLLELEEPLNQALLLQAGSPVCDVAVYALSYGTVDAADEPTTTGGALMVPAGGAERCSGGRPIVLYAHGTSTDETFDLTNLDDGENAEGLYLAAFFAAHGYVVVAPNYVGYGTSALERHPYLVARQQAADMIDALAAARAALPVPDAPGTTDGGKLFLTGYSQGGYVALATQREMEAAGMTVTASAPLSGPYAPSAFVDAVFFGRVNGGATVLGTFLFTAYQHAYGDVYSDPSQMFEAPYAGTVETLFPSSQSRSSLYEQGLLPREGFFSATPPDPEFAAITPPITGEPLDAAYARGFAASGFLIRNDYRLAYLRDAQAHPDGFWPNTTPTAGPAANPQLGLRRALQRNDLRTWTPTTPTLLCGGHDDPTVFWLNTAAMAAYWAARAPGAPYTVLDVDAAPTGDQDPYADLKRRFGLAKDLFAFQAVVQGADDGGLEAVLENYHAALVAPFCLEAAQELFERH